jgi:hypothetical protein
MLFMPSLFSNLCFASSVIMLSEARLLKVKTAGSYGVKASAVSITSLCPR